MSQKKALVNFTKVKKIRFNQNDLLLKQSEIKSTKIMEEANVSEAKNSTVVDNKYLNDEYDNYLERIIGIIKNTNPQVTQKSNFTLVAPIVQKVGTRSAWSNFSQLCESLGRPIEHVYAFFSKELGTETSLGGDNQLFMKGRYTSSKLETMIVKYTKEFVICSNCKSKDTVLNKQNKLQVVECSKCGHTKPVAKI